MAASLEILLAIHSIHETRKQYLFRQHVLSLDELPLELRRTPDDLSGLKEYITKSDKYGQFIESNASLFVDDS